MGVIAMLAVASLAFARSPIQGGTNPAKGVRCPDGFATEFDAAEKTLRCRKDLVKWVVTTCSDKSFATYVVKNGPDACAPTEIPGVGTPPGAKGSKPVECATQGYRMMTDRTALRDRCERVEIQFAIPLPAN